jgi:hypothetical protein
MLMPNPPVQPAREPEPMGGLEYRRHLAVYGDSPAVCAPMDRATPEEIPQHRSAKAQQPEPDHGYKLSAGEREARHIGITCCAPNWLKDSRRFELIVGAWIDGWPQISEMLERAEEEREDALTPVAAVLEAADVRRIGDHIARIYRLTGVWIEPQDRLCIDDETGEVRPMRAGDYDQLIREIKCDLAKWRAVQ